MQAIERDLVGDLIVYDEILSSQRAFDITMPLTDVEKGMMADRFDVSVTPGESPKDLEDELYTFREPTSEAAPVSDPQGYSEEYRNYLRWQEIAAWVAHDEAWRSFQELVLLPYVKQRKQDDENYSGYDRDQAFALRLKRLCAEEFVRHILAMAMNAAEVSKPVLIGGKPTADSVRIDRRGE